MGTTFRPYHPDQALLLAPSVRDWLPEGHLADHVSDLVEGLDLTVFYAPYEEDGRRKSPYEPRMMLKVLIYGYATGCFRRVGSRASWRRTLRSGFLVRGTSRATARSASFIGAIWRTSRGCS